MAELGMVGGTSQLYAGSAAQIGTVFDPSGKYKLIQQGAFAAVEASISEGDELKSEGGAMVTMSSNIDLDTKMEGGFAASCFRCCCTGESIFFSHYKLKPGQGTRGDVLLAPSVPGEIIMLELDSKLTWCVQPRSFLACDKSVNIGTRTLSAAQGCCGGEGFFVIEASGAGRILINSFGSILKYDLQPGEVRKIDNTNLVAWHSTMNFQIGMAASKLMSSFFSGEGLVTVFTGPGTVYIQTRSLKGLANALNPYFAAAAAATGASVSVGDGIASALNS